MHTESAESKEEHLVGIFAKTGALTSLRMYPHSTQNGVGHYTLKLALPLGRTSGWVPCARFIRSTATCQPLRKTISALRQDAHIRFNSPRLANSSGLIPTLPNIALHSRSLTLLGFLAAAMPKAAAMIRIRQKLER